MFHCCLLSEQATRQTDSAARSAADCAMDELPYQWQQAATQDIMI